jgi:hypothetical protein
MEFVWLLAGVLSGLCLVGSLWVLAAPDGLSDRGPTVAVLVVLVLIWAGIFSGLKKRRRWGWWLSAVTFGLLTSASVIGCIWGWVSVLLKGLGDRHGVGAAGQLILCSALTVATAIFGYPFFVVLRARRQFITGAGEDKPRQTTRA